MTILRASVLIALCFAVLLSVGRADDAAGKNKAAARPYGIQKRIPWNTSRLLASPDPPDLYRLERAFPKLAFQNPVVLTNAPGTDRLFLVELAGKIHTFPSRGNPAKTDLAVDLIKENPEITRVYGLTFHPKFEQNRYCYICYVLKQELPKGTRVCRYRVSKTDPPQIDYKSEKVILEWKSGGHNGGCLKFGPDGYLYISTGDGAGAFPPDSLHSGQDVSNLLSCVLRIDVDKTENGKPYRIPPDNPFVGTPGARGEIWSYGHRNPWKMSFDSKTGDLWVGDVGWEMWEMIYRVQKGDNYGWSVVEASQSVHPEYKAGPTPIVPPTIAHSHTEARSITGGFVYRGKRLKDLYGTYIYGDYVTGKLWGARHDGKKITWNKELLDSPLQIICFGVDNREELYVVTYDGTIHRLVKNDVVKSNARFPKKLSETGLFASTKDHKVAPGAIPYSVIVEPWMDGATAKRYVALPGKSTLGIHADNNVQKGILRGEWAYPNNAVLMKTIFLKLADGTTRRVETQILHRVGDQWKAYNYVWNDDQTDAVFLEGPAKDQTFIVREGNAGKRRQTWHHASRTECQICHTTRGGSVYGFLPEQLDRDRDYGRVTDNQLRTLKHIELFKELPKGKRPALIKPSNYGDPDKLSRAARSYLHVNCGTCHRRGGGGTSQFELVFDKMPKDKYLFDARPTQGTFGIHDARTISPGDPSRSVLLYRMAKVGKGHMPHIGSNAVDRRGFLLMQEWIRLTDENGKTWPHISQNPAIHKVVQRNGLVMRRVRSLVLLQKHDKRLRPIVDDLLGSTASAFELWQWIFTRDKSSPLDQHIIDIAVKHSDPQIRDLFESLLPEERRTKRLGTVVDVVALLRVKGDMERGRKVFFRTAGVSCMNCHKIQGKGKEVGPDLSHVGKKNTRAQLLESILEPSKKIDKKFLVYLVQTTRGKIHTGLLKKRDAKEVVLTDKDGKPVRIPAGEVELMVPQRKSMMPELLLRDMTAKQVADLLEFLAGLK